MVSAGRLAARAADAESARQKPGLRVFVEGGAPHLWGHATRAFTKLVERLQLPRMPKFIPCGGRAEAYRLFCSHVSAAKGPAILLVDAEDVAPPPRSPWRHVKQRKGDGWVPPVGVTDDELFFMAVVTETWILVSHSESFRTHDRVEQVPKDKVYALLNKAAPAWREKNKAKTFELLEKVDPQLLMQHCPEFDFLVRRLRNQ